MLREHGRAVLTRTLARLSVCALSATSLALAAVTATATASPVSPKTAVPTAVTPAGSPHKAALADPVTVPSPGDGTSVAVLDSSPRYSARTNMDIETVNTKFAEIVKHFNDDETTEQALEDRATSLAVSGGHLICLSTPYGKRGFFYKAWAQGHDEWKRIEIPATQISRILMVSRLIKRDVSRSSRT